MNMDFTIIFVMQPLHDTPKVSDSLVQYRVCHCSIPRDYLLRDARHDRSVDHTLPPFARRFRSPATLAWDSLVDPAQL
ncbi:hypothetical protein K503DRAFT_502727 [Rhizopogon vinicolor AM-OR11-026]|uniref:Uncharacterized protein n=1 Tax=Rhizopogon vinicolor AM-OR11-026 TaxID=1314800 RepID=A0A1B7N9B2_9AGAM|nr:hypothetical protein K503DRAFT_502727 [Rhizopogon vinicolor AM-OR11-026]